MNKLRLLLTQLENHIPNHEKLDTKVSQSNVGWQIDHSLLVINSIINQLKTSDPKHYRWKFNKMRIFFRIVNTIPRGKVKSPKVVQPVQNASIEELMKKLTLAKENIAALEILHPNSYFSHPFFGDLNLKAAIWFLKLHTKHHLKIIDDIVRKG